MKPTFSGLLVAVLASAALAVADSPGSGAAAAPSARFALAVDGVEIAQFGRLGVAQGHAWLDLTLGRRQARSALPRKLEIGAFSADRNEVAIESLTLAHEGFEIR